MGRWIVGIEQERKLVLLQVPAVVGAPACVTDSADCCTGTGPHPNEDDCCTGEEVDPELAFQLAGPLLNSCDPCTSLGSNLSGFVTQDDIDTLVWKNNEVVAGCGNQVGLDLTLYCSGTSWRASGTITRPGKLSTIGFDIPMTLDPVTLELLLGSITIPSCGNATLIISHPCPGELTFDCVDGECVGVAGTSGDFSTLESCQAICELEGTIPPPTCSECPPGGVPATLNFSISSNRACLNTTGTATNSGSGHWNSSGVTLCGTPNDIDVSCDSSPDWKVQVGSTPCSGAPGNAGTATAFSGTCSPFRMNFLIYACWWDGTAPPDETAVLEVWE